MTSASSPWDGRLSPQQLTGALPFFTTGPAGTSGPHSSFATALAHQPSHILDPTAMLEIATTGYPFADRTPVEGISRLPFLTSVDGHGHQRAQPLPAAEVYGTSTAAPALLQLLEAELAAAIGSRSRVGILLSGGMDSRIVAGVVRRLQQAGRIACDVVALTWGTADSRDVVYASTLAESLHWEWRHIELTSAVLRRNIVLMANSGAEVSPLHLHGLPDVAAMDDLQLVIAGTYGDSVGRAEYSGKHVLALPRPAPRLVDPFGAFPQLAGRATRRAIAGDASDWRSQVSYREEWQYREIEHQRHYLRRLLQATMSTALEPLPLYQAFTAPDVYAAMLALRPEHRRDTHYKEVLRQLDPVLQETPWARTGLGFDSPSRRDVDALRGRHHRYGEWLRGDCAGVVTELIRESPLWEWQHVQGLLTDWRRTKTDDYTRVDSLVAWLASLGAMCATYDVAVPHGSRAVATAYALRGRAYRVAYRSAKDRRRQQGQPSQGPPAVTSSGDL